MELKFKTHLSEKLTSENEVSYEWYQIRHIPKDCQDSKFIEDQFQGEEKYGDPCDNSKAWARKFIAEQGRVMVNKFKIESSDKSLT